MDGIKLEYDADLFNIAFSFSHIVHFGGEMHWSIKKHEKDIAGTKANRYCCNNNRIHTQ
jgi:hypothetical protein